MNLTLYKENKATTRYVKKLLTIPAEKVNEDVLIKQM